MAIQPSPLKPDLQQLQEECTKVLVDPLGIEGNHGPAGRNTLDGKGQFLLGRIIDNYSDLPRLWSIGAIDALTKKGVKWIGSDSLLEKLLLSSAGSIRSDLLNPVLSELVRQNSENPVFLLARWAPGVLLAWAGANPGVQEPLPEHWLKERDDQGRTLSHHLWSKESLLALHAHQAIDATNEASEEALTKLWIGSLRVCWRLQQKISDMGLSMDIADHTGQTAIDLCVERIDDEEAVLFNNMNICDMIEAHIQRRALDNKAPLAPTGRRIRL